MLVDFIDFLTLWIQQEICNKIVVIRLTMCYTTLWNVRESKMVNFGYIQHNNINLLIIFTKLETSTLNCTNVQSAVKLNTKKVVLLHKHTQRRLHHSSVALLMMRCSKPCHNVGPFMLWIFLRQTRCWIFIKIL